MTHIAGNNIDVMAKTIHEISTSKGFTPPSLDNLPEKLMLSVSELAEAMEEHRSTAGMVYFKYTGSGEVGNGIEWLSGKPELDGREFSHADLLALGFDAKPEGILVEIADSIIRNLHMMHSLIEEEGEDFQYSVSDIINLKINYNAGRPAMHGKAY